MTKAMASFSQPGWPVLIAFGSNIDPLTNVQHGLRRLHQEIGLQAISQIYRTAALPDPDEPEQTTPNPDFLNGAVLVETSMEALSLRQLLRSIEAECQRVRCSQRYAPRTLDLDIAFMGEQTITTDLLVIPDPDIAHRSFLAIPLAELAPDALHPIEKISLARIAARFGPHPGGLTVDSHATALLQAIL